MYRSINEYANWPKLRKLPRNKITNSVFIEGTPLLPSILQRPPKSHTWPAYSNYLGKKIVRKLFFHAPDKLDLLLILSKLGDLTSKYFLTLSSQEPKIFGTKYSLGPFMALFSVPRGYMKPFLSGFNHKNGKKKVCLELFFG